MDSRQIRADKTAVINHRLRAREYGLTQHFTFSELQNLRLTCGEKCAYCGQAVKLTVDHIIPLSRGGANDITNIALVCRICNSSKGDLTPSEWTYRWYISSSMRSDPNPGRIVNHVPELVARKFGSKSSISFVKVSKETGLAYGVVASWIKGAVIQFDLPTLFAWCAYLEVDVDQIFTLRS